MNGLFLDLHLKLNLKKLHISQVAEWYTQLNNAMDSGRGSALSEDASRKFIIQVRCPDFKNLMV
jgi:hypothetical protein